MQIPRIQISQTPARIGIQTTPAALEISQRPAEQTIRQPHGELEIEHKDVFVQIDNYPPRYDLGYKNSADFIRDEAELGKQIALEAVGNYAAEGDRLRAVENPGNTLEEIAYENSQPEPVELGVKWLRPPEYNVSPPQLTIRYTPREPEIDAQPQRPQYTYTKGGVDIRVTQYPGVRITWPGQFLDIQA